MRFIKGTLVLGSGHIAFLYLANIGAGVIELIPDNIPIIGNLDEAAATLLLLNCLAYFGLDLRRSITPTSTLKPETEEPNKTRHGNRH
jgi:hypothetical protein